MLMNTPLGLNVHKSQTSFPAPLERAAWLAARRDLRVLGTADLVAEALAHVEAPGPVLTIARPFAAGQITEAVASLLEGQAAFDGGADGALAALWLKPDHGEPIHPLEAS